MEWQPFHPTKILDLIGIAERKYIDHTGTHLNRGIADIMRYAALVTYSDISDFGEHHMLPDAGRKVSLRLPDEALYALAVYLASLQPPPNHNPVNAKAEAGQKLFDREGCSGCHTAPLYTNNRLTLAAGFLLPPDLPSTLDVMKISVGTDPSLALKTRKGTGFYKVPSLKGVWYRGRYCTMVLSARWKKCSIPSVQRRTSFGQGFPESIISTTQFLAMSSVLSSAWKSGGS